MLGHAFSLSVDTGGSLFIGNLKPEGRQGRGATCKVLGMPPGDQKAAERKPVGPTVDGPTLAAVLGSLSGTRVLAGVTVV